MSYSESAPPERLAAYVACVWSRSRPAPIVVPDGCVDLVWTGGDVVVGGAAGAALGMPASELLDSNPALADVWPEASEWPERIATVPERAERLATFLDLVGPRLAEAKDPDPLTRSAALALARPRAHVGALARGLFISQRQLRRRFDDAVGYSPRTLARVLRLQRFLRIANGGRELARAAADADMQTSPT